MLEAKNLCFKYGSGGDPVLQDVSFSIGAGEIVGLGGPSGSGKSTLAKLLAGYLTPASGSILLDGKPIKQKGAYPVQMLFQTPELAVNPRTTIREILTEFVPENGLLWKQFGIRGAWLDRFPHELSGGELQRVCIARTLIPGVRVFIADEISSAVDAITQAEIWRVLLSYAVSTRTALVVISHDQCLLERVTTRRLIMESGIMTAPVA
jgi:ABC-type dipeptide/oligopeptide/nickel transport system ATPase subunit